jgi:uncharacterized protein (DUF1501 family)
MKSRRTFLCHAAALSAGAAFTPRLSWAHAETDRRLIVVLLRGGLDGLSLLPPHGDPGYAPARGKLAIPPPGGGEGAAFAANELLGIHPSMPTVAELWACGEATLLHAVGFIGAERSHFEAQDLLEGGGPTPRAQRTGWLSRALSALGPPPAAAAIGSGMPLLLRGDAPATVIDPGLQTSDQEELLDRLASLYADDPVFGAALMQSHQTRAMLEALPESAGGSRRSGRLKQIRAIGATASTVLAGESGARVAALDVGGWDTHAGQASMLSVRLEALDAALAGLRAGLGSAWEQTAVVVVTEFGRTVEANGTGGTDHGTGGAALLLGGAVRGGVRADWPGLRAADRLDGRDLRPTTDLRAVFKGLLRDQLGVPVRAIEQDVFPDSPEVRPLDDLVRA